MKSTDTKGFAVLGLVLIVLLVGVIGFAGWTVYSNSKDDTNSTATSEQVAADETAEQTINTASDIDTSTQELDSADIDSQLDTSGLDEDINAVL